MLRTLALLLVLVALAGCSSGQGSTSQVKDLQATITALQKAQATPTPTMAPTAPPTVAPTVVQAQPPSAPTQTLFVVYQTCYAKLQAPFTDLETLGNQFSTYTGALGLNPFNSTAVAGLQHLAAQANVDNVQIQAVTCDPRASDFLTLIKAGVQADSDGFAEGATGAAAFNSQTVLDGSQKLKNAGALFDKANSLVTAAKNSGQ